MFAAQRQILFGGTPGWLPKADGVPAAVYADFANERYFYQGRKSTFSAWLTALGGSFSRSSTAYHTNSAGLLESVGTNVLRYDYDPVTLAARGILLEGARTNVALQSQTFGTTWTALQTSVSSNTTVAPDGTTTADTLTDDGSTNRHILYQVIGPTFSGQNVALSVYAKAGTNNFVYLQLSGGAARWTTVVYDLSAVSVSQTGVGGSSGTIVSSSITSVGNGWYRLAAVLNVSDAVEGYFIIGIAPAASGNSLDASTGAVSYAGASNLSVILWGAQCEGNVSFASSYIPTTSGSVTRAADLLTFPFTNTTVTCLVTTNGAAAANPNGALVAATNDGGGLFADSSSNAILYNQTTNVLAGLTGNWTANHKVAFSGNASGRSAVADNNTVGSDANALFSNAPANFAIGSRPDGVSPNFIRVGSLALWPNLVVTGNNLKALTV